MITEKLFEYDSKYSPRVVAGMDEAGRGPLAGPVVAACVIMPLDCMVDGINDSKKVSEARREKLYDEIKSRAIAYGVGIADNRIIDEINILNATKKAMNEAYAQMGMRPQILLVDAVNGLDTDCECVPIIKGDATSYNIAAASILAKVTRDRIMREYDTEFPVYGFAKHKGYGTRVHIEALLKHGKCEIHRDTFIRNFTGESVR